METNQKILEGYKDMEKGAYLGAIASLATADRQATEEELQHLSSLSEAADISEQQKSIVLQAATDMQGEDLNKCLDVLKGSELRYSLVADLLAFAKSDSNYTPEEEKHIRMIATHLGLDQKQFETLDEFAGEAVQSGNGGGDTQAAHLLSGEGDQGGWSNKLQSAGIGSSGLLKGLLAMAAPMLLGRMFGGRSGGGMFGGSRGGMMGGMMGGGLGSLIGMLSGGRGIGSTGGLLGRMLGGRGRGFGF